MADIAYKTWSLIPRDLEPATQDPSLRNPPLMPNIALDAGASLCFELPSRVADLRARIAVTAMSVEARQEGFLQVLSGTAGALQVLQPEWSRSQDGPTVVLVAHLGGAGPRIKLHLPDGPTVVVSAVDFEG